MGALDFYYRKAEACLERCKFLVKMKEFIVTYNNNIYEMPNKEQVSDWWASSWVAVTLK